MVNIFEGDAFKSVSLTNAINLLPNLYGKLEAMNLFPAKFVRTRHVAVEERNGVLSLLPTQDRRGPSTMAKSEGRKLRSFLIPYIPYDDVVMAEEVQDIRAFGTETELQSVANVVADHLQSMRNKHAITLEHLRMGALKGTILDADGSVLVNLFTEFEIAPKVVSFALGTTTTDVKKKCLEVVRHIEDNLRGEYMSGVRCLVSSDFFDALTSHAKVKEAYERWMQGAALREDMRSGFTFGGITFEEYRGQATDPSGAVRKFIADGEGHCFPTGTSESFVTYFAPGNFMGTVNTLGQQLYASQERAEHDRGVKIHTESNPLPLCLRPGVLVKLTAA